MTGSESNLAHEAARRASNLKCPTGDYGRKLANSLNLRNLPMIVSALEALGIEDDDRIMEMGPGDGGTPQLCSLPCREPELCWGGNISAHVRAGLHRQ